VAPQQYLVLLQIKGSHGREPPTIGMLAERFNLATDDAWELLRTAARNNRREVRALATEVSESRERTPEEIVQAIRLREDR